MASKLNNNLLHNGTLYGNKNLSFGEQRYLIRIDKEAIGLVDTEKEALATINSIASSEEKRLGAAGLTILYRRSRDGNEIQIVSQHAGRLQTYLRQEIVIDFICISQINYISPYADRIAQYKADKAKASSSSF